ncbi:MAG TPA: type II secretion system protein [Gaiellaceae bacterium]|nr:type II secretion system protein [Gaiellaceae bacterium]
MLVRLLREQRGYSLMELLVAISILGAVMTSVSILLVSATTSEVDMNRRFQAQTEARLGLDLMRREVHCAMSVSPVGASASVTLTIPATCPTSGGNTAITWCTVANGSNRWGLWRYPGSTCTGTGKRYADYLTASSIFTYTAQTVDKLAFLSVRLPVNLKPSEPRFLYNLEDDIVLRNSTRS